MRYRAIIGAALVVVTLAVFWQVRGHDFINFDDPAYVTENPRVQQGVSPDTVAWAFTTRHAANWHPVTWLSHMADCQLYGLSPAGHHLTSLALHAASALLLFLLLARMTGAVWPSAFVAALFALHPLHVESVAWVAERKDVLSAFFWMLTLLLYARYAERPGPARYLATLGAFALGLMAKPMLVTLPFVLLLLDYWPLGRLGAGKGVVAGDIPPEEATPSHPFPIRRLVQEKVPFLILAIASSAVTFYVQQKGGAVTTLKGVPLSFRLVNALVAYRQYLEKTVWPHDLAIFYPLPSTLTVWQGGTAALLLAAITVLALRAARRFPYCLVGWLWYLGTLLPVIGLVQVGRQAMADRYTYIPLVGIFIMAAWGIPALVRNYRWSGMALGGAACAVLVALGTCTWLQLRYWQNSITLFGHAATVVPNNNMALVHLGTALAGEGKTGEAVRCFTEALRIQPDDYEAHNNLGLALAEQGDATGAVYHFSLALRANPDSADAHYNMGVALAKEGKMDEAVAQFRDAARIKPDAAATRFTLGATLAALGKLDEAGEEFAAALRANPAFAEAHYSLGIVLAKQGKFDAAAMHFAAAVRARPGFTEAERALDAVRHLTSKGSGGLSPQAR